MSEVSEPSPKLQRRRRARWICLALVGGVAQMAAIRQHWLDAATNAALATLFALQPTALAHDATKARQTRYLIVAIAALLLQAWTFFSHARP